MIDRRLVEYFDWWLLILTALLAGMGLISLYSALDVAGGGALAGLFTRQLIWYAVGTIIMVVAFLFNYKNFERWAHLIYVACVLLLVAVLLFGKHVGGAQRWLALGPVSIQPSEIIKLAMVVVLAKYFVRVANPDGVGIRELAVPVFLTAVPFVLIQRQPDLGTALVLALIAGSITLFIKIERRTLVFLSIGMTLFVPLVWSMLKGYQKLRILTFLNPDRDPLGAGYHIIQSKIAIGSGMIFGKGFLKGTQNVLDFLPEQHTDFIFSVMAEEWGLIGVLLMLLIFLLILARGLQIAQRSRDLFGTILAVGVTAIIFWQVFINIGMVTGLMPVVGVTLPFISYGGSSVITMMAGVGLLLNISMRRFMFEK